MKHLTEHLWFETPHRRDYLNITNTVADLVRRSGVQEGLCLVNAMHITQFLSSIRPNMRHIDSSRKLGWPKSIGRIFGLLHRIRGQADLGDVQLSQDI